MKVGIIGGGITGLTAALELLKKGYEVTVIENELYWGGLSSAFKILPGVFIERYYHHLFTSDEEILGLCKELGIYGKLKTLDGKTSHLFEGKIYPLDSPLAVLRFSPLNIIERIRFGLVTLYLKLKKDGEGFSNITADWWLRKWYGQRAYTVVWKPLLQGKFANDYDKVSMTWFWARVKKRTAKLIYPIGGFQVIIDSLIKAISEKGGTLIGSAKVEKVETTIDNSWQILVRTAGDSGNELHESYRFDKLIITTSLKTFTKMFPSLPQSYKSKLNSVNYLSAQILILVLSRRLSSHYWINIGDASFPFLVVGEQSNLFGLDYYHGKSVVYLGNYLPDGDRRLSMNRAELLDLCLPYLKKINPEFEKSWVENAINFVGPFAQPVVDLDYKNKIPSFKTPLKNLYLATMAQVYPWDRGTNYAVKLAKDIVKTL